MGLKSRTRASPNCKKRCRTARSIGTNPAAPPAAGAGPKNRGSFPAIVPLNNPWELRAFGVTHQPPRPLLPPVRVRLPATRCARQALYCWRLDTPTEGAEHETSAGSAAGDGNGRVWGGSEYQASITLANSSMIVPLPVSGANRCDNHFSRVPFSSGFRGHGSGLQIRHPGPGGGSPRTRSHHVAPGCLTLVMPWTWDHLRFLLRIVAAHTLTTGRNLAGS